MRHLLILVLVISASCAHQQIVDEKLALQEERLAHQKTKIEQLEKHVKILHAAVQRVFSVAHRHEQPDEPEWK
jgi:hypothetical protein